MGGIGWGCAEKFPYVEVISIPEFQVDVRR